MKGIRYRIADVFYPEAAIRRLKIKGRRLTAEEASREFEEAAIIAVLWFMFLGIGMFLLLLALLQGEYTLEIVIFEVSSAQGNLGLSSGITDPGMPTYGKVTFLFNMWIGRLEIIPVLVTFRAFLKRGGLYR